MTTETFQLELSAAETYEEKFVPAIFAEWAEAIVAAARLAPGQRVLDVACGTGAVARRAAQIVDAEQVTGVDINAAMLAVAARVSPDIHWQRGDAEALPLPDAAFDTVFCQMSLMFFPDPGRALREMARVARTGGTVAVAVPGLLTEQPAYGPFVELAGRYAGSDAMALLGTYWACGDPAWLRGVFEDAGLAVTDVITHTGTAHYGSAEEFVAVEVNSTPLAARLDPAQYEAIRAGARDVLAPFRQDDGSVAVPLNGVLVTARKDAR